MRHSRGVLSPLQVVWIVVALGTISCTTAPQQRSVEPQQPSVGPQRPSVSSEHLSIVLTSVTSPVRHGNAASIIVKTAPGAACTIIVAYKSGPSRAQGLIPKTADKDGVVSWAWIVGTRTTPGEWPVTVTCSSGGRQATFETSFLVQ